MDARSSYNEYVIRTRADDEWDSRFGGEEPLRLPPFSHPSARLSEEPSPTIDHSADGSSSNDGFWNFIQGAAIAVAVVCIVYDSVSWLISKWQSWRTPNP